MRIDIEKIVREGGFLDATIPLGMLEWEPGTELEVQPLVLRGRLARVQRGHDFNARLEGGITLECVRCLAPFRFRLSFDFHLLFVPGEEGPRPGESQIQRADCDSYPCTDGKVDLSAVAMEQVYLHIPLKPVCQDECRGLCPACREDLNRGPCRCAQPEGVRVV